MEADVKKREDWHYKNILIKLFVLLFFFFLSFNNPNQWSYSEQHFKIVNAYNIFFFLFKENLRF